MKNLFADANIIIDFLALREPFSSDAAALFDLAEKGKVKIFISAVSFNVVFYFLRQKYRHTKTLEFLNELYTLVIILDV
jgi:predicted nucleic acid-binding protein